MQQLVCEMCGSTEFIKQNDMFVCQYCKTRYTMPQSPQMNAGHTQSSGASANISAEAVNAAYYNNLLQKGNTYLQLKDYGAAVQAFQTLVDKFPYKAVGYEKLIRALTRDFNPRSTSDTAKLKNLSSRMQQVAAEEEKEHITEISIKTAEYCRILDLRQKTIQDIVQIECNQIPDLKRQISVDKVKRQNKLAGFVISCGITIVAGAIISAASEISGTNFIFPPFLGILGIPVIMGVIFFFSWIKMQRTFAKDNRELLELNQKLTELKQKLNND